MTLKQGFIEFMRERGSSEQKIREILNCVDWKEMQKMIEEGIQEVWIVPTNLSKIWEVVDKKKLEQEIKPVEIKEEKYKRFKTWDIQGYKITQIKVLHPSILPEGC